ncbi:MAG: site-specific integrase [Velocimicrobium sp.]
MNTVEPIRDIGLVLDIADYMKARNERDYVMFMFGIYSGLRISDILLFRVRDVRDKDSIMIREKKTNKEKRFAINEELKRIIKEYIKEKKDYEYLFKSREKSREGKNRSISRQQAYNIMNDAAKIFGLESIGTHTLRKTFGYHTYQQTKDAVTLMKIFNHADISVTLRYIGVNQDSMDAVIKKLKFER